MRPDEDYAEMDETQVTGSSRAMSWMVLGVAVAGFAALAYYAYHSGSKTVADGETTTIQADASPIKETPANPEGEQFPDKDKTIYDVIAPNGQQAGGEKLMPEAEHPVAATNVEDSEDDAPVSATVAAPTAAPTPAPGATATTPPAAPATTSTFVAGEPAKAETTSKVTQTVSEQPVATTAKPVATTKPASYAAPQMVNEKTLTGKKEAATETAKPAAKPKAEVKKAAATPAAKPAAGGAYMVQLGAFKSESEAQAAWKKLSGAHKDVLSGSPTIVKADVNGTTFYRLRTGSYASSADAKSACSKLGGAACMPVK